MSDDIDDRMEAQEAEYEMGIQHELEQAEADSERLYCKGCGNELLAENCWMDDGCPCNTPRGVNDGNQQISEWRREREQRASHEIERLRTELAAARAERDAAVGVLESIYPSVAGMVIRYKAANELNAAEKWGAMADKVFAAMKPEPPTAKGESA